MLALGCAYASSCSAVQIVDVHFLAVLSAQLVANGYNYMQCVKYAAKFIKITDANN